MVMHFRGGMSFAAGKPYPWPELPSELAVQPLRVTCPNTPIVKVGQTVEVGQRLTEPLHPKSPCFFSPIKGVIGAVTGWEPDAVYYHNHHRDPHTRKHPARKLFDIQIVPVKSEGDGEGDEVMAATSLNVEPPAKPELRAWFDHLRSFGPWQQDGIGCDLVTQLAAVLQSKKQSVRGLVCIGLDSYSPYPDRSSLLLSFPDDAALGLQVLGNLLDVKRPRMVVPDIGSVVDVMKRPCKSFGVKLVTDVNRYPAADPTLVAYGHCHGGRLKARALPTDAGVVMVTPWTVIRIARWVTRRRLDLVQPVMIAEPQRDKHPQRHYAFAGTQICDVDHTLHGCPQRLQGKLIVGNPMTGLSLSAPSTTNKGLLSPTVRHSMQLLTILSSTPRLKSSPCITCGWCTDVCPTELQPVHLVEVIEEYKKRVGGDGGVGPEQGIGLPRKVQEQLDYCVDCGLCTHVCPSHLPLTQLLHETSEMQQRAMG